MQSALDNNSWQHFVKALRKAMLACNHNGADVDDHFNEVVKMIEVGSEAKRKTLNSNFRTTLTF